jgi:hypothetical protein
MILNRIRKAIQISILAAGAALGSGAAQAAAYTGTWDPAYGSPFPNLGWRGEASFYIPDACLLSPDGWLNNSAACSAGAMAITSGHVDLYNVTTGTEFANFDFSNSFSGVTQMEIVNHNLGGIRGGFMIPWNPNLSSLGYGKDTYFWLAFDGGPAMFHVTCDARGGLGSLKNGGSGVLPFPSTTATKGEVKGWVNSNYNGQCGSDIDSFGWNSNGQSGGGRGPLSWSTAGSLVRTDISQIPEPASLALVLSALGAGWVARRRRA